MAHHNSLELSLLTATYLSDLQVRAYRPSTIAGYKAKLKRFVQWAESVQASLLKDFSPNLLKQYIRYLQSDHRWSTHPNKRKTKQPTLSPVAVRNYVRDVKAFASWLLEEGYTSSNVLSSLRNPKADETPIKPFTDGEIEKIFASLDPTDTFGIRDYVVLHTLWDTGMRVGELVRLTLDDTDLKTCQIRVSHAKFGKWRDIGFGRQTHKFLSRYLAIARPEPVLEDERRFFLSLDGYPLNENTVKKICQRVATRTGIHVHAHRFRHTFAVNMLKAGTDLRTLQRLMGHADIRILTRYLNLASEDAIATHRSNSPADRFHAQQSHTRRIPYNRGT